MSAVLKHLSVTHRYDHWGQSHFSILTEGVICFHYDKRSRPLLGNFVPFMMVLPKITSPFPPTRESRQRKRSSSMVVKGAVSETCGPLGVRGRVNGSLSSSMAVIRCLMRLIWRMGRSNRAVRLPYWGSGEQFNKVMERDWVSSMRIRSRLLKHWQALRFNSAFRPYILLICVFPRNVDNDQMIKPTTLSLLV